jgi:hypothetical protein
MDVAAPPTRSVGRRTFLLGGTSAAALGTAGYFIFKSDPREPLAASGCRAAWSTKAGSGVVVDGSRVFLGASTGTVVALDSERFSSWFGCVGGYGL